jgi:hypothetical protein
MPGLISITQRADGDNITAAIYNSDRQEIVNGMEPDMIDDPAPNVSAFQAAIDPGEVGSEVLPNTLQDWVQEVQFVIKEMKGTAQWYSSTVTKVIHPQVLGAFTQGNWGWPEGADTVIPLFFKFPTDLATGNLTVNLVRRAAGSTGTFRMSAQCWRIRNGTVLGVIDAGSAFSLTPGDVNSHITTYNIPVTTLAAGDYVRVDFSRFGASLPAEDTATSFLAFDGVTVTYTGYAGRS